MISSLSLAALFSALTAADYAKLAAAAAFGVGLYLLYKVAWPRDYGVPVKRRLLCGGLKVQRDQIAFVPLWWSDVQIQRAIKSHWKRTLQQSFGTSSARTRG